MNRTSHAVDHDKRKDAFTAVLFVALENIIFPMCCTGIGSSLHTFHSFQAGSLGGWDT